ncbi:MAG: glycosyltransferase family 2 protein [Deltaproteobacteria bacterium]|nr:glycosyltransferase family 2 protein [Deltaproteobacteria bacterium]
MTRNLSFHPMEKGVTIIIPTFNGGSIFSECLAAIKGQKYVDPLQLIVVDSGSTDGTVERAEKAGALVKKIERKTFHHARTRNKALALAAHENIIFTVQDAIPHSKTWLLNLVQTLNHRGAAAAYTAQIPHDHATPYSRFEIESINEARGSLPVIQRMESLESYEKMSYHTAYRTIGLDNVCAIYRKDRLLKTPFPEVDFAEDMAWAHKNLLMGHKIVYNPHVRVKHSHNRSPNYAFRRQVVNSFWCAKIMGRVEEDFSFLTEADLKTLTAIVGGFKSGQRSDIFAGKAHQEAKDPQHQEILGRHPKGSRVNGLLQKRIFGRCRPPTSLEKIVEGIETRIAMLYQLIGEKFGVARSAERISLLEQVVANTMGRAYGEIYASRMLAGNRTASFESLMRPFLDGV